MGREREGRTRRRLGRSSSHYHPAVRGRVEWVKVEGETYREHEVVEKRGYNIEDEHDSGVKI